MFICFDKIQERDRRTDGQTDTARRHSRAASRGKTHSYVTKIELSRPRPRLRQ